MANHPTNALQSAHLALKNHLQKQNIHISWQRYGIEALNFMALGLFCSLILGLIIKNIGTWLQLSWLVEIGTQAQAMMGAAIGAGVAHALKAPPLVILTSVSTGLAGASMGGAVGAFVAALIGAEFGKFVHRTTPIDIIVTPMVTLIVGMAVAGFVSPWIDALMLSLGELIMWAVELSPVLMSVVVAVVMGLMLTLPISSAAIAISLNLSGLAAGAATIGCVSQMVGFATMSKKDNGISGVLACGLGTSMILMPNILKNPKIWLPPTLTSAVLAPFATAMFGMSNIPSGAGMGTSGLVGQVGTLNAMGMQPSTWALMAVFHFILPAFLTWLFAKWCYHKNWIKAGDLTLNQS
ncbi:PTS transporter subunit IIC [Moraxella marmotae]|uniref:PTS transporter subunit IIC n=1 Tax=Moraxella marmotae TaxID=3344520 RepID=UPI0035D4624F